MSFFCSPLRRLRIGIDFHGTVVDTQTALRRYISHKYRVRIPMEHMYRQAIMEHKYLTHHQLEDALHAVIADRRYMMRHVNIRTGATQMIQRLQYSDHFVEIISASGEDAGTALRDVLFTKCKLIGLSTRILGRHVIKGIVARDYDVVLEDNPAQAEAFHVNGTQDVFLLSHQANASIPISESITRVSTCDEFLRELIERYDRRYDWMTPRQQET